ncbi:MAG TPA: hypothetical protein VMX75_08375 [Spirochaetia bacterium]|nr:hypothetical protein [Spirochaetia bacterium]
MGNNVSACHFLKGDSHVTETVQKDNEKGSQTYDAGKENNILGFGLLSRLPGLWNGPVSSTTPAGSFAVWYVDFRPVSPGQISQYSTLDSRTLNYISFFIVKHDNQLKIALRTEGIFQNKGCVTYEVLDRVRESEGYYRFSYFQAGEKRAYTEFTFLNNDKFIMEVYTNKFNKVYPLQLHSRWEARRGDRKAASGAVSHFSFPQPVMIKNFSDVFRNLTESIYFSTENDPYDSSSQPFVGNVTVNISIDKDLKVESNHELFLLLTTESLFEGLRYTRENLKYISKYVYLPVSTKSYTFNNVHPGKYYLYSYNDINRDKKHLRGDYMSSDLNNVFTLQANGNGTVDTKIDFVIP